MKLNCDWHCSIASPRVKLIIILGLIIEEFQHFGILKFIPFSECWIDDAKNAVSFGQKFFKFPEPDEFVWKMFILIWVTVNHLFTYIVSQLSFRITIMLTFLYRFQLGSTIRVITTCRNFFRSDFSMSLPKRELLM